MTPFGQYVRATCPVCGSTESAVACWRIPVGTVDPPAIINGVGANLLPVLNATMLTEWDRCVACQSIYLNPILTAQYQSEDYAQNHLAQPNRLDGYRGRWSWIRGHIAVTDTVLADVCCGAGELLELAREDGGACWRLMIALEWSVAYTTHLRKLGFEAHQIDASISSPAASLPPCDVILFMEAFEHMRYPGKIVADLATALKPGGRLLFSAEALEGNLPVRPYESVYVNRAAVEALCERCGLVVDECVLQSGRWLVAARRPSCTA